MPKTVNVGERVVLKGGRKVGTPESPGSCDLRGVRVQIVDDPSVRVGSVDGKMRERVTVRPVMPSGKLGMPLDVPVEHVRDEDRSTNRFGPLGRAWAKVFGEKQKSPRERGVVASESKYDPVKKKLVVTETFADGSVATREE